MWTSGVRFSRTSVRWFPVFLVAASLTRSSLSQVTSYSQLCPNGSYPEFFDVVSTTFAMRTEVTATQQLPQESSTAPSFECVLCNATIDNCTECHVNDSIGDPICDSCSSGYELTKDRLNCTAKPGGGGGGGGGSQSNIIGIIVGSVVGGVLLLAVVAGVVVYLVRTGKCSFPSLSRCSTPPPPMPNPEGGVSFKKSPQNSGTGQANLRYTKEPGSTPPRVESVQYEGYPGPSEVYMNSEGLAGTSGDSDDEVVYENAPDQQQEGEKQEEEDGGDLYMNSEQTEEATAAAAAAAAAARKSNRSATTSAVVETRNASRVGGGKKSEPPKPKPKPKPPSKPSTQLSHQSNRTSMYPPSAAEEDDQPVYNNEVFGDDDDNDDEDYVNCTQFPPT